MSKKHIAKQRLRFWQEDSRCYYCGVVTIYKTNHDKQLYTAQERDRLATIDHLRPRHHPGRLEPYRHGQEPRRHVLACWKCNNERDRRETRELPREFLCAQSGAVPLAQRDTLELQNILRRISLIKPRGRYNRNRVRRSLEAVLWTLFERGMDDEESTYQPDTSTAREAADERATQWYPGSFTSTSEWPEGSCATLGLL